MEKSGYDDASWDTIPWLSEVALFAYINRKLVADWPTTYIVAFYFIMSNMYDFYFTKIEEHALVQSSVFATFFTSSKALDPCQDDADNMQNKPDNGHTKQPFEIDSGISCLLSDKNYLLTLPQKDILRSMLNLETDAKVPGWLRLHVYIGNMDGKYHMVHCSCCVHDIAEVLVTVLENNCRHKLDRNFTAEAPKRLPRMIKRILQCIPTEALDTREMFRREHQGKIDWGLHVHFTNGTIEHRVPRTLYYQRFIVACAVFLLYIYMPHSFAFRQLCKIIQRANHQSLVEIAAIIDRMILNFPKEVDAWSIKLYLLKALMRLIPQKDPSFINNTLLLLDRRCTDVQGFCLEVTKKGHMNGKISWFLWNLYRYMRDRSTKRVRKHTQFRIQRLLDYHFIQMYTALLMENNGYQGIFYLYLHIVKRDPIGMEKLRELCLKTGSNVSWKANLKIVDNIMASNQSPTI